MIVTLAFREAISTTDPQTFLKFYLREPVFAGDGKWLNKYRILHGKCARRVFTHELWRIRNRTSERSERVRFLIQNNECVNTVQSTGTGNERWWSRFRVLRLPKYNFLLSTRQIIFFSHNARRNKGKRASTTSSNRK